MRCIVVLFVAATFFSSPVWPVEYRHLAIRFVEAKNFVRLSEYFTGRENPGNRLICRSQPEKRSGLYFILTLSEKSRKLPVGSAFVMEVIRPDDPEAKTIRIPVPEKRPRGKEVYLGLTGADWPDKSARPVAWRLCLVDASGEVLADRKSFLWEHPAKKAESGS